MNKIILLSVLFLYCCVGLIGMGGCGNKNKKEIAQEPLGEYAGADVPFPRIQYFDGTISVNDRCAVSREKLHLRVPPVYVNGLPVGFCSINCADMFSKEPEKYLKGLDIRFKCAVSQDADAVLKAGSRAFVNKEAYYFASAENLREFVKAPFRYSGRVSDPVSGERFQPTADSPRRNRGGRAFYFIGEATASEFDELMANTRSAAANQSAAQ